MRPFDPRLLTQVPSTRRPVAALGAIGVLQGLATIALAFAVTNLVVAVAEGREVLRPGVWLVGLFAVRALLAMASELVGSWAGLRVSTVLRERLITAWMERDADSRPEAGRAQALATQGMTSIEPYVARYLPALVSGAVLPLLAIGTLAFVDWPSALIVVLTVPLLPVFAALIGHTTQESTQRRWRSLSALSGHFLDVMRGLPTLASYGRADAQVETIAAVSRRHRLATMQTLRLAFMSSAALELLATISVALVAVTVGIRLANGVMPLDIAMLAILLAPEAYWPVRRVGAEFHSAADGAVALDEVISELDPATTHRPNTHGPDTADRAFSPVFDAETPRSAVSGGGRRGRILLPGRGHRRPERPVPRVSDRSHGRDRPFRRRQVDAAGAAGRTPPADCRHRHGTSLTSGHPTALPRTRDRERQPQPRE